MAKKDMVKAGFKPGCIVKDISSGNIGLMTKYNIQDCITVKMEHSTRTTHYSEYQVVAESLQKYTQIITEYAKTGGINDVLNEITRRRQITDDLTLNANLS